MAAPEVTVAVFVFEAHEEYTKEEDPEDYLLVECQVTDNYDFLNRILRHFIFTIFLRGRLFFLIIVIISLKSLQTNISNEA